MIKLHEVRKGDGYYSLMFSEGLNLFGAFIVVITEGVYHIEFMEFAKNRKDIINITKDSHPEKFAEMKEKYLADILRGLEKEE